MNEQSVSHMTTKMQNIVQRDDGDRNDGGDDIGINVGKRRRDERKKSIEKKNE